MFSSAVCGDGQPCEGDGTNEGEGQVGADIEDPDVYKNRIVIILLGSAKSEHEDTRQAYVEQEMKRGS
ncbi:hypothetical protein Hypma_010417 [Hypsizygus marmoreus]|uniref:Uncharacterized protein n=1 Tax=Hypsizygus marmoreus TaxID=39966 RepID=A0A369JUK3_HYPMA|nr:hypothetical protein Hypma_010417 [Hypsizygus marmoreus]